MLKPARSSSPPPLKIGFPRAMVYFEYGQLWRDFFESLGCEVVLSPKTNKSILNRGVASCTNETCLPVKALHGHVLELCGKVDFVFLPRYVSCGKRDYTCPKLCALPDMARLNLKEAPPILEAVVDEKTGYIETEKSLKAAASALGLEKDRVLSAFYAALRRHKLPAPPPEGKGPAVGLLGHPYMLHDECLNMGLAEKLAQRGLRVLTPEDVSPGARRSEIYPFEGRVFYGVGLDNLGSARVLARMPRVRGLIYLTPFACGVDSLVTEFIELSLKGSTPWMKLTVDEHTGEAGFDTRIEAFLDMIGV